MNKTNVVFVGVGGYGDVYLTLYIKYNELYCDRINIAGIVDPFCEKAPKYDWIKQNRIPVYNTLEEFYSENSADLAVISTPIPLHKEQCITALNNGSNVLCEKPLVPTVDEASELDNAVKSCKKKLGVGFQWSFSDTMLALKRDILNGKFGAPLDLRSLICWKRPDSYYNGTWKGNLYSSDGAPLLDSVVTNATAHYLHNIFFILGDSLNTAALPSSVEAEVYRAKNIQSFDTAVLRGAFRSGARFWYGATHSGDGADVTSFRYIFEKAELRFNIDKTDDHVYAVNRDGKSTDYGNPQDFEQLNRKLQAMISVCEGDYDIPCTQETIMPHLRVCNGLFSRVGINDLPDKYIFHDNNPSGTYVKNLSDAMNKAYLSGEMLCCTDSPIAAGLTVKPVQYNPAEITHFDGVKK